MYVVKILINLNILINIPFKMMGMHVHYMQLIQLPFVLLFEFYKINFR